MQQLLALFLILTGIASAQLTITNVTNAGNRFTATSNFRGIAQGAVFLVTAKGIGPADVQQASFPLPTADGLAGVSIQATVEGVTVDAPMVYVAANEAAAILPSSTPIGTGTIRVTSNSGIATAAIKVVASAFGIFTRPGFSGLANAFNVSPDDGSTSPNTTDQTAKPGQDVVISGTGLGAIPSDETQRGVTDVPAAAATVQVWVGVKPATVVSAGRGACCDGLDPAFRIPQGIAAWDVIRFTLPDGVAGCWVPIAVQTGSFVSNLAVVSISPDGGKCAPPVSNLPPELVTQLGDKKGVTVAELNFNRAVATDVTNQGAVRTTKNDSGGASFTSTADVPASAFATDYAYLENACQIGGFPGPNGGPTVNGVGVPLGPLKTVNIDAGPAITVKGAAGTRTIPRVTVANLIEYRGTNFGNSTPGNYFDPGPYTVSGTGGKDAGAFSATLDVPQTRFEWTNPPDVLQPVDRSQDFVVKWKGGIPGSQVTIAGISTVSGVAEAFTCAAPVSAGEMTIPSWVLLYLPPTATGPGSLRGGLTVENTLPHAITIPGIDVATVSFTEYYHLSSLTWK
jgi:uncharacterized protein (TIGR03437 family)